MCASLTASKMMGHGKRWRAKEEASEKKISSLISLLPPLHREPVPVLEKTLRSVLNLDYPGEQMSVNILPDGFYGKNNKSVEIFQMVRKVLQEEATKLRQGRSRSKTYIDARVTSCRIQLLKTAPDPDERKMREYLEQLMEGMRGGWREKREKVSYLITTTLSFCCCYRFGRETAILTQSYVARWRVCLGVGSFRRGNECALSCS
jgi:cellulose synthase/poly-beta-1,6-N-acetylglucosamine synthase-like glycosyltransferase